MEAKPSDTQAAALDLLRDLDAIRSLARRAIDPAPPDEAPFASDLVTWRTRAASTWPNQVAAVEPVLDLIAKGRRWPVLIPPLPAADSASAWVVRAARAVVEHLGEAGPGMSDVARELLARRLWAVLGEMDADAVREEVEREHNALDDVATDDLTAFRPAKEMLDETCPTYKALNRTLKANPWVRIRRPSPRRLEVHAGDWARLIAGRSSGRGDALDLPAAVVDEVVRIERRKREVQRKRLDNSTR